MKTNNQHDADKAPNGHGEGATPDDEFHHARLPHLDSSLRSPLPEGEETNVSLREFYVNAGPEQPVNTTRRDLAKSGLMLSGVMLTLASRSAVGGNFVCKSPSGFLSGNLSAHGTPITCSGRSSGYWGTHPTQWPAPYQAGTCSNSTCTQAADWSHGTTFRSVFNCNGQGTIYAQYSMMQVVWLGGNLDPNQLGAHVVAAVLNARMGSTPILTEAQVANIFNEWNLKGYFEPTAGVKWYAADIVAYLQSTMA
jgi:hypothetical protein